MDTSVLTTTQDLPTTAADLCTAIARRYEAQDGPRASALASTLRELAELYSTLHYSSRDLLAAWGRALHAPTGEMVAAATARKVTVAEWISLAGGLPRDLQPAHWSAGQDLLLDTAAWAERRAAAAPSDRRLSAMAETARREASQP